MRLDRILDFNPETRVIRAQGGASWEKLRGMAEGQGLLLPGAMPERATLGAVLACNEWGPESQRYGPPASHAISARVWDGKGAEAVYHCQNSQTGHLDSSFPLGSLFCGTHGRLGIIGEASIRLLPMPESCARIIALFDSPASLSSALVALQEQKYDPASLLVFNNSCLKAMNFPAASSWLLFMEIHDHSCAINAELDKALCCISQNDGKITSCKSQDPEKWPGRLASILASRNRNLRFESVGAPLDRLSGLLENIDSLAKRYQLETWVFGPALSGRFLALCDNGSTKNSDSFFHDLFILDLVLNGQLESDEHLPENRHAWFANRPGKNVESALERFFDPDNIFANPQDLSAK